MDYLRSVLFVGNSLLNGGIERTIKAVSPALTLVASLSQGKVIVKFLLSMLGLLGLAASGLYLVPKIRTGSWDETRVTSTKSGTKIISVADEADIKQQMQNKISEYDIRRDLRKIRSIPDTPASLEAAFRNHKTDVCEQLPPGDQMAFSQYTLALTPRDQHREASLLFPATRREFLTIGLTMTSTDEKALPTLSRSIIANYLEQHYVSLQARLSKDPTSGDWILNYRPIAAVGKFGGLPYSQEWQEAISSTVQDICGLGIVDPSDPQDKSQTAVLLFRFAWIDDSINQTVYRHELGFLHAVPRQNIKDGEDPFEVHLLTTSNERKKWHYFAPQASIILKARMACKILGTVRFDEYMGDGLTPKRATTRRIEMRSSSNFEVEAIKQYLASKGLQGNWNTNIKHILNGILNSEIPSS